MLHPGKAGLKVLGGRRGEKNYTDLPKLYTFPSREAKEHILYENFVQVNREVEQMCIDITQFAKK